MYALLSLVSPLVMTLALGAAAVAAPPATRPPTAKWVVDFHETQCVAMRNYGTANAPLTLYLKAPALGDVVQVGVIRPGKDGRFADQLDAKISINGREATRTTMLSFKPSKAKNRIYRANLPQQQFELPRTAQTISLQAGRELNETLALTQTGSLLRVLDECVADLKKVWNVTENDTSPANLKERATGTLQGLIRPEDYPDVALRELAGGSARFLMLIDETGRIADCTVTETSGIAALDAQSCALITERARFKPAIGLDGKPAKDARQQRWTWQVL